MTENELLQFKPMVTTIASLYKRRLFNNTMVAHEDLVQAGWLGLIEANRTYDASRGCEFSTHARFRVRGAVMDYLRSLDTVSRADRKRIRSGEDEEVETCSLEARMSTGFNIPSREPSHVLNAAIDVHAALELLPPKVQQVIKRVWFDDAPKSKVAEELGLSKTRITQLQQEGINKMRSRLAVN